MPTARNGLTLIEVIVAMLFFSIGALGLAASSAAIVRQMAMSSARSRSMAIVRTRSETAHSLSCERASSGKETVSGIDVSWIATRRASLWLDQRVDRVAAKGRTTDWFRSAIPCS